MPNKKASRNAYFYFALDMIPELRRRGLEVSGVREAIPHCSEYWALLSVEEKEKYSEKARGYKGKSVEPTLPRNYPDNWGQREEPRKETLYAQGDGAQVVSLYKQNKGMDQNVFYFLDIFSHGEMPAMCEQRFVPCEIGCVRYSLRDGIMGSFHEFIDPGELPRGFRYHCQNGSAATHQIPISGFELANNDYHNMFRGLCDFVSPAPAMKAPVFCKANDAYRIKWCLQWLAKKAGMDNKFELNEVESLIMKLYKEKLEEPSRASVCRMLDVVHWDYASNTRCEWHEENDMWCCALASCKKMTYCISKALASVYGITITSAHLPSNDVVNDEHAGNEKIIVLDAKRFQKQTNRGPKYSSDYLERSPSEPGGVHQSRGCVGRGRGILRLLESFAISQNKSG
ncbi:protein maelstrom homolog [Spea bombifrons]|uniref:protein maelstrom homolog n=1 Tax=Spea bombifrons TaxID=233779 RepID=UPI00234B3B4D|nr:protein maelstrom homolog [Spea bombifrons]